MIHLRIIRTICLIYIARVIRRKPLTRAWPSAVLKMGPAAQSESPIQSFAKGDPIIGLKRPNGQKAIMHAGHLPEHVLRHFFGDQDRTEDLSARGKSKVIVDHADCETNLLGLLWYVRRSVRQEMLFLRLSPAHRRMLKVLRDGEELELFWKFAQEPGVTVLGMFGPTPKVLDELCAALCRRPMVRPAHVLPSFRADAVAKPDCVVPALLASQLHGPYSAPRRPLPHPRSAPPAGQ
jgi:hypothetical protein